MKGLIYQVNILRYEGDSNAGRIVYRHDITADEAIELMLHIQENVHGPQEEAPEEEEPEIVAEPEPVITAKRKYTKRPDATQAIESLPKRKGSMTCKICGKPGHNARTCAQQRPDALPPFSEPEADPAIEELERMISEEPKLSIDELSMMFPTIALYQIVATRERALKTV